MITIEEIKRGAEYKPDSDLPQELNYWRKVAYTLGLTVYGCDILSAEINLNNNHYGRSTGITKPIGDFILEMGNLTLKQADEIESIKSSFYDRCKVIEMQLEDKKQLQRKIDILEYAIDFCVATHPSNKDKCPDEVDRIVQNIIALSTTAVNNQPNNKE